MKPTRRGFGISHSPGRVSPARPSSWRATIDAERLTAIAAAFIVVLASALLLLGWQYWRESRRAEARARRSAEAVVSTLAQDFANQAVMAGWSVLLETLVPAFSPDMDDLGQTASAMAQRARQYSGSCNCAVAAPSVFVIFGMSGERVGQVAVDSADRLTASQLEDLRAFAREAPDDLRRVHVRPLTLASGRALAHLRVSRSSRGERIGAAVVVPLAELGPRVLLPTWKALVRQVYRAVPEPDSLFAMEVKTRDGLVLAQGDWRGSGISDSVDFWNASPPLLRVTIALNPAFMELSVPGGVPASATGVLVMAGSLLLLTVGGGLFALHRARQLMRARTLFLSGVSHELRTPLTQVLMYAESLDRPELDDRRRRKAHEVIVREARRLIYMIENVLLFARGRGTQLPLNPRPHALAALVASILDDLQPLFARDGATVEASLQEDSWADVDAGAFRQIIVNLLDNALRYGPSPQRLLVTVATDAGRALVTVQDEGPGIPPADRERVWQPFAKLSRDAHNEGAGIGLSLVRQLSQAMHGGAGFVDTGRPGLTAVVWFPRVLPPPGESRPALHVSDAREEAS